MAKVYFNEDVVRELPAPAKGNRTHFFRGAIIEGKEVPRGFGVQVTANGIKSFTLSYRDASGRQRRETIGRWPTWKCVKAARRAHDLRQALDRGEAIGKTKADAEHAVTGPTVNSVLDEFIKAYVHERRSAHEIVRLIDKDIRPALGAMAIHSVRRSDINAMLASIRSRSANRSRGGKVTAERTMSVLRKCFGWYAVDSEDPRSNDFVSPIVRGMGRPKPEEKAERIGRRVLCRDRSGQGSDDDLETLWQALEYPEEGEDRLPKRYPAFIRTLAYTAQRRGEVAGMHERELETDAGGKWVWRIPASRYKTKLEQVVPLPKQVVAELRAIGAKPGGARYVFTEGGTKPFSDYSGPKEVLNRRMDKIRLEDKQPLVANFGLHDLRRTARTLLSRSETVKGHDVPAVRADIAEMCLGHVLPGLQNVYDQHDYLPEIREALQLLADRIDRIVSW